MNKSYAFLCKYSNIKYACLANFKKNKIFYIICLILCLIGLFTGIFVAFKSGITVSTLNDYNLYYYTSLDLASFGLFFTRLLSYACFLIILSICSLNVFLVPIGIVLIAYRTYLAGFNCCILISLFGISGAITSIIIIFPFQLIITFLLILYFALMINRSEQKKKFGYCLIKFWKTYLIFFAILTIVNLLETILLIVLNAGTIFVL